MPGPASSSSQAPQVGPGEQRYVPTQEQLPAEAAGGGPIANQIAETQGRAAEAATSGVQLEVIRENQADASRLMTQYKGQAAQLLYSMDPSNLGLTNQPASSFDQNVHSVRQHLSEMADQYLEAAPNGIAKDMLRKGMDSQMDVYEQDIQHAGFQAHKVQQLSSMTEFANQSVQESALLPNAESVLSHTAATAAFVKKQMEPYWGVNADGTPVVPTQKILDDLARNTYKGWALLQMNGDKDAHIAGGNFAGALSLLEKPEVQDAFSQNPKALEDLRGQATAGISHHQGYSNVAPSWFQKMGYDGEGAALDQVNDHFEDDKVSRKAAQAGVREYFGSQRSEEMAYFAEYGTFRPGVQMSPKLKENIYKSYYGTPSGSDPRALAAANQLLLYKRGTQAWQDAVNTDWNDPNVFPGLVREDRQKFANMAEKAAKGQQFTDPAVATAFSIGVNAIYHYWPETNKLPFESDFFGSGGHLQNPAFSDFVNGMVKRAQSQVEAGRTPTYLDLSKWADEGVSSLLRQNPQMLQEAAEQAAQQRGVTSATGIYAIRQAMVEGLGTNRSGYYGQ